MVRETIVWETGGGAAVMFTTLTKTNYTAWEILMRIALQDASLWEAVDTGEATEWQEHEVLDAILRSVSSDMVTALRLFGKTCFQVYLLSEITLRLLSVEAL
jgi:hypothetical protein